MVKSVSCPTAEMTGTRQATSARATRSSLKAHRSSMEPPPRPTMITSSSTMVWRCARACTISPGASSPCTRTGVMRICRSPKRRPMMLSMSRIGGERPLAPVVEEPFRLELSLELLEGELERAQALRLHHLHHELVLPPRRVEVKAAEGHHLHAVLELEAHAAAAAA